MVAALFIAHSQTSDPRQESRLDGAALWRHVTFILKALAFFLVGIEVPDTFQALSNQEKEQVGLLVLVIVLALILSRVIFVMTMLGTSKERGPDDWRVVLVAAWSGARGPVSGMAAFSIPLTLDSGAPLPFRNLILATTFGVIVVTLLLSSTMGPLARVLKVPPSDDSELIRRVDIALAHAAAAQLEEAVERSALQGEPLPRAVVDPLKRAVNLRLEAFEESDLDEAEGRSHQGLDLARLMLRAEQEELLLALADGWLGRLEGLDARLAALPAQPHVAAWRACVALAEHRLDDAHKLLDPLQGEALTEPLVLAAQLEMALQDPEATDVRIAELRKAWLAAEVRHGRLGRSARSQRWEVALELRTWGLEPPVRWPLTGRLGR